nr:phosphoribosylanthranilate isomerase [Bacillus sp. FJAT-29790]
MALFAIENGADAIGFVFAESKRSITPESAGEIISQLPDGILKVGVFVNETKEMIEEIVNLAGINTIQLHGDESPEFCSGFSLPVVKALSISSTEDLSKINDYSCEYLLLDSPKGKYRGGNGIAFDWSMLADVELNEKKIILAGGLTIENVAEGIEKAAPYMVDVSSGVETDGKKDAAKIKRFIEKAKSTMKEEVK